MNRKPSLKATISISLALASALSLAGPASAGGLLGGAGGLAAGATGGIGGAVGLGAGGGPLGGLGGVGGGLMGSGNGLVGATLGGNGLQPGFGSSLSRPLTSVTSGGASGLGGGRAWGSFEDAKGTLSGKTGLATDRVKQVAGKGAASANGVLGSSLGASKGTAQSAKAGGLNSVTDGFVLSRSFELPAQAPVQGRAQAKAKASSSTSGSASAARGARIASNVNGSAQVEAGR
jgi:hypothetical protein